jgi:hypothetical protein
MEIRNQQINKSRTQRSSAEAEQNPQTHIGTTTHHRNNLIIRNQRRNTVEEQNPQTRLGTPPHYLTIRTHHVLPEK